MKTKKKDKAQDKSTRSPEAPPQPSGDIEIAVSRELYSGLRAAAKSEGVGLDQFVSVALATDLGRREGYEHGFTDGFNMAVKHLSGVKLVPKDAPPLKRSKRD